MRTGIHSKHHPVVFEDASTGKRFLTKRWGTGWSMSGAGELFWRDAGCQAP